MIETHCVFGRAKLAHASNLCRLATFLVLASATPALPEDGYVGPIMNFVNAHVRDWLSDPLIMESLKAQNAANQALTQADIQALDTEWISELNKPVHPMIDRVLAKPLSQFLLRKEDATSGGITEIFIMDAKGLNAGQSSVTSDYWQGDEAKFKRSFEAGPDAVFVDAPAQDESTQMLQSQVSITIVDEQNKPIGAITVGINLDQL